MKSVRQLISDAPNNALVSQLRKETRDLTLYVRDVVWEPVWEAEAHLEAMVWNEVS